MARAQQLAPLRLVEPDGAPGVSAHLRVGHHVVDRPVLAARLRGQLAGLQADQQGLRGLVADVALGEGGDHPADTRVVGAHGLALLGDEAHPVAVRRGLEAPAGTGAERADREEGGEPERRHRSEQHLGEEVAPAEGLLARLEVGHEGGSVLRRGAHAAAGLGVGALGHEALGPDHEADPDAAEREEEQHAFGLGLAARGVHHREAEGGGDADTEAEPGQELPAPALDPGLVVGGHLDERLGRPSLGRFLNHGSSGG